jgi:hypothetical protein
MAEEATKESKKRLRPDRENLFLAKPESGKPAKNSKTDATIPKMDAVETTRPFQHTPPARYNAPLIPFTVMMPNPYYSQMFLSGMPPYQAALSSSNAPKQTPETVLTVNGERSEQVKNDAIGKATLNKSKGEKKDVPSTEWFNNSIFYPPTMTPMQAAQNVLPQFLMVPRPTFTSPGFASTQGLINKGVPISLACDTEQLSEYQILIRHQLELFEAGPEDVESNTQGRKKPVVPMQVGLRCRHCATFPLRARGRGAVYYPSKLFGIYQAAQNMAGSHLCNSCQQIPYNLKQAIKKLRERRDNASGGKQYWADGARVLGLYETDAGLRMNAPVPKPDVA